VFRNFQTALRLAGFTIDYAGGPGQLCGTPGRDLDNAGVITPKLLTEKGMKQESAAAWPCTG